MRRPFVVLIVVLILLLLLIYWALRSTIWSYNQVPMVLHNAYPFITFDRIRQYLDANVNIRAQPKDNNTIADRSSVKLDPKSHAFLYDLIETNSFGLRNARVSHKVPVEYRIYKKGSSGMKWHTDVRVLPTEVKYYEVTLTISNDSDCRFEYITSPESFKQLPGAHVAFNTSRNQEIRSVQTAANTAILVPPGKIRHRATELTYGERLFLKFIVEYD